MVCTQRETILFRRIIFTLAKCSYSHKKCPSSALGALLVIIVTFKILQLNDKKCSLMGNSPTVVLNLTLVVYYSWDSL